jgi:glycosyltransferase involved in cell wall biosynthesis
VSSLPSLSIVVVSFNRGPLLDACLTSLEEQARQANAEVLVVRAGAVEGADWDSMRSRFGQVRWLSAPADSTIPRLRRLGIASARAEIVGLLEDDCVIEAGWCAAALEAHRGPWAAVGGAVEPGPYRRSADWAVYLYEYGRFMRPFEAGPTTDLPGNNVTYKRKALESIRDLDPDGFYDVFVHRQLLAAGEGLFRTPTLVVQNRNFWTLSHIAVSPFHHGRGFAAKRGGGLSPGNRAIRALLAPFLPLLQVYRLARLTIGRRRLVGRLIVALPATVLFSGSWAAGECLGYLAGPGKSVQRWR